MLHLLPLRLILWAFAFVAAVSLGLAFAGLPDDSHFLTSLSTLVRWSGSLVTIGTIVLFAAWRWIPLLQSAIFPYLGGSWRGFVEFKDNDKEESREVTLEVRHLLTRISMILDSAESSSRTLVVHAEKNKDFDRYRLYYVYLNERKEGTKGAGQRYRGLAVIRIETAAPMQMAGDYFTETHREGTLMLHRVAANPWWKLWR